MADTDPRKPRLFEADDPSLEITASAPDAPDPFSDSADPRTTEPRIPVLLEGAKRGLRWGAILAATAGSLLMMALVLRFWQFVWDLFQRSDWIGWVALTLAVLLCISIVMLLIKELVGFFRVSRLRAFRAEAEAVHAGSATPSAGTALTKRLAGLYDKRTELAWTLQSYRAHDGDIMSPAERMALFDRTVLAAVDDQVRTIVMQSARRVAVVTAVTPFMIVDLVFVLYENLRMLRRVATLYGGRPGTVGLFRLAGRVLGHLLATGGIALTDDLLSQFIGQGVLKRLSARAGEGLFNGALTARIGVAAVDLCRPLPFIAAPPVRLRELAGNLVGALTQGRREAER
jgi:putative membrane protein